MASIEPTKTGPDGKPVRETRWRARYRDPSGRSRSRTFDRKVDAQQYVSGVETDIDRGRWADPQLQRTTFDTWADRWLDTLDVRPSTRHGYLHGLRRLRRRFTGERISTIDRAAVRAFVAEMRRDGYAPKTIRSTVLVLKLILDLPLEDKVIFENPAVRQKLGTARQREPVFLTADELRHSPTPPETPWTTLILFAGYTGLRPAELAGLRVKRLDLLRGRAEIRDTLTLVSGNLVAGPTKTYETRTVPLPAFLRELMAAHLAHRVVEAGWTPSGEDHVFVGHQGGPLRSDKLQRPRHPAGRSADRTTGRVPDLRPPPHVRLAPHRRRSPSPGDHGAPRAQGHQDHAERLRPPLPRAPGRAE